MALSPETHALLDGRQERIAAALASLGESTGMPSEMQILSERVDRLMGRRKDRRPRAPDVSADIARIRGRRALREELRVSISEWQGRQRVELRQWHVPIGATEWKPKRHGIVLWPGTISALIAALAVAEDELSGPLPDA